jgi:hypothetical protein
LTSGFLALQKRHQPHALFYELPLAIMLKKEGHAVILLDESGKEKQIDATIDGILFDMKDMSHTVNYFERLKKKPRDTLKIRLSKRSYFNWRYGIVRQYKNYFTPFSTSTTDKIH